MQNVSPFLQEYSLPAIVEVPEPSMTWNTDEAVVWIGGLDLPAEMRVADAPKVRLTVFSQLPFRHSANMTYSRIRQPSGTALMCFLRCPRQAEPSCGSMETR